MSQERKCELPYNLGFLNLVCGPRPPHFLCEIPLYIQLFIFENNSVNLIVTIFWTHPCPCSVADTGREKIAVKEEGNRMLLGKNVHKSKRFWVNHILVFGTNPCVGLSTGFAVSFFQACSLCSACAGRSRREHCFSTVKHGLYCFCSGGDVPLTGSFALMKVVSMMKVVL